MSMILSAFMDGFTGGGLLNRLRRPGAPTQVFADSNSTQPQAELMDSLLQRQAEQAARHTDVKTTERVAFSSLKREIHGVSQ